MAVVLGSAAVLSFDGLRGLALAVSISPWLAWLMPIVVDAGAAVSCAVWLGGRSAKDAASFAGRMTWALLLVTVAGNAGQLGMHAHGVVPPWWVAVAVGAIAPAVVGATVHLVVLMVRTTETTRTAGPTTQTAVTVVEPTPPAIEAVPDVPTDELLPAVREWIGKQTGTPSQRQLRSEFGVGADRARRLMEAA